MNKSGKGSLKDLNQKSKEVYKPFLDNPFAKSPEWPEVAPATARTILDFLVQLLGGYGQYLQVKKTKKDTSLEEPSVLKNVTVGFNLTVKALERQAAPNREKVFKKRRTEPTKNDSHHGYIKYVFVAKKDLSTPLLSECFPLLTFSASQSASNKVKLIELPKGSIEKLLAALHTENVFVLSLSLAWREGKPLFDLIDKEVKDVEVPWLEGIFGDAKELFVKPPVKFVKTTRGGRRERKGNSGLSGLKGLNIIQNQHNQET